MRLEWALRSVAGEQKFLWNIFGCFEFLREKKETMVQYSLFRTSEKKYICIFASEWHTPSTFIFIRSLFARFVYFETKIWLSLMSRERENRVCYHFSEPERIFAKRCSFHRIDKLNKNESKQKGIVQQFLSQSNIE